MGIIDNSSIKKEVDDLFNFKHYAKKVQKIIQNNADNSAPLTIGIYGKWGEGKTSFLNLIENKIDSWIKKDKEKGILKYHFNPWRYSTEDEMLFDFFDGLAKSMYVNKKNERFKEIGKQLIKYSRYAKAIKLSASVGISSSNKIGATFDVSEIMKALGEDLEGEEATLNTLIKEINDKLEEAQYKVVVFIDDIDRLDKDEIYTILKLIKLNANFNNFVYIVALDEEYVAKAISKRYGDNIEDGELFLEKIINIPVHLPKVEAEDFKIFFELKLKEVINNLGFSEREEELEEIKSEFQYHYFKNGREVIRILNSFFITAFAIGEDVHLRDLFWLEFLKVKYRAVFEYLKNFNKYRVRDKIITIEDFFGVRGAIETHYNILEGFSEDIVRLLLPSNNNLLGGEKRRIDLRIDHQENFEKYFSYHTERKIPSFRKNELLQNIENEEEDNLRNNLIKLRDDDNIDTNLFNSLIKDFVRDENIRFQFFYSFLLSNLDLFPRDNISNPNLGFNTFKVIELICSSIEIKRLSFLLSLEELTFEELFVFIRNLKGNPNLLEIAEKEYLNRVKEKFNSENTSLINSDLSRGGKALVFSVWRKYEVNGYVKELERSIKSVEDVRNLILIFIKQDKNKELLEATEYRKIDKYIDCAFIYGKIAEYSKQTIEKISTDEAFGIFLNEESNQVLEQFVYWHKKYLDNN